jgi:multisubunit Na+/H+ antiporter MnhB subunit
MTFTKRLFLMKITKKADWFIPTGLITFSLIPVLASAVRPWEIVSNAQITTENARFLEMPLPILLHIIGFVPFCILGAFQFSPGLRRRKPGMHRATGWLIIPCGLLGALAGLWMTLFYPSADVGMLRFDGPYLYATRLLAGAAMALFLILGLAAILRRDIPNHEAWMMRSYALALGAGTQVFTHIPWLLFPSIHGELARTLCMAAGWVINLMVVETLLFLRLGDPLKISVDDDPYSCNQ